MVFSYLNWVLLLITCLSPTLVRAQLPGCNFQVVDLVPCLNRPSEKTTEACCLALNQALKAGHHCLCSLLASTNLQLTSTNPLFTLPPLSMAFSGCYLSSPSLAACGVPLEMNSLPVTNKEPVLTPTATAPVPKPVDSSTNSTSTQTGKPQLVKGPPRSSKNMVPMSGSESQNEVSGGRRKMRCESTVTLVWIIAIYAWIV